MASASSAAALLKSKLNVPVDIRADKEEPRTAFGNGNGIFLVAETSTGCLIGGDGLGKRGVSGETVGAKAAEMLLENLEHGGCVDNHLQDQLIVFMALAAGVSRIRCGAPTLHTKTAIHVAELLTDAQFTVKEEEGGKNCVIECEGIALKAQK